MSLNQKSRSELWTTYKNLIPEVDRGLTYSQSTKINLITAIEAILTVPVPEDYSVRYIKFNTLLKRKLQRRAITKRITVELGVRICNIKVSSDLITVEAFVDNPKITIKRIEYLANQTPKQLTKILDAKLISYADALNYYQYRIIAIENVESTPLDFSPNGLYRATEIPIYSYKLTTTDIRGNTIDVRSLTVHASKPPLYASLGLEASTGVEGQCALNALVKDLQGIPNFTNLTRASVEDTMNVMNKLRMTEEGVKTTRRAFDVDNIQIINIQDYITNIGISFYLVGRENKVIWKHLNTNGHIEHALYYKVANGHLYPIDDESIKSEIRYNLEIKRAVIDWTDVNIKTDSGDVEAIYKKISTEPEELDKTEVVVITSLFKQVPTGEISQNSLNLIVEAIYRNENLLVENLTYNKNGDIIGFSYKLKWVVLNADYYNVVSTLEIIRKMPEVKSLSKFVFQNQSLQMILTALIGELRGKFPDSNLSASVSDLFESEKRGAFTENVRNLEEKEIPNAFTFDITKCHTSIINNRFHAWGIFRPWDELIKKDTTEIVEGAYYQVFKPSLKLGANHIGNGLYDSQFIFNLLENHLIEFSNITHELRPSLTIEAKYFKEIVDLIYSRCTNIALAKILFNKFIGSLGKTTITTITGELCTSDAFAEHWKYDAQSCGSSDKFDEKPTAGYSRTNPIKDHLRNLYKTTITKMINTNFPVYQAILQNSWWLLFLMEIDAVRLSKVKIEPVRYHSDSITFALLRTLITDKLGKPKFVYEKPFKADKIKEICGQYMLIQPNAVRGRNEGEEFSKWSDLYTTETIQNRENELFSDTEDEEEDETKQIITDIPIRFIEVPINETTKAKIGSTAELVHNMNQHIKSNPWKLGYIREVMLDNPNYETIKFDRKTRSVVERDELIKTVTEIYEGDITEKILNKECFAVFGSAGTGKTFLTTKTIIPAIIKSDLSFIAVSLSHKAVHNLRKNGVSGIVIAKLFALNVGQSIKSKLLEISQTYSYIIVDEYTMCGLQEMNNFYTLFKLGVKFIFIGDYKQLPAIESKQLLDYRQCAFFQDMIDKQFIELKTRHRFDLGLSITLDHLIKESELIGITNDITGTIEQEICYTNKKRYERNLSYSNDNQSYKKHLKIREDFVIRVGSKIICKVNRIEGFSNNAMFVVDSFDENNITLYGDNKLTTIDIIKFGGSFKGINSFELGHCITVHASQGSTIYGRMAIHEVKLMSVEMLYTALSRATSLDNICIKKGDQNLKNIEHENFIKIGEWIPIKIDCNRKALKGSVWVLYDKTTTEEMLIGSCSDATDLKDVLYKAQHGILKGYTNLGIKILHEVHYDFDDELFMSEQKVILNHQANNIHLLNPKVAMPKRLKIGKFKPNKARELLEKEGENVESHSNGLRKLRGCISVLKDCVEFQYSVNGKSLKKRFKITKTRTSEQAKTEAEAFQKEHYK
jgi:hypothetical protein